MSSIIVEMAGTMADLRQMAGDVYKRQASVCNLWKQGTEHDGPELYEKSVCIGISGISDHGRCV